MNIYHPLDALPQGWPMWTFFITWLVLFLITGTLATPDLEAPGVTHRRIVALERPADADAARGLIAEWERAGKLGEIRRCIRGDNIFVIVYSTLTALGCVMAARAFFNPGSTGYGVALLVAWLPWVAGVLDYVENYAMYRMLGGFAGETLPSLSWWCATVKFAIILTLGVWGVVGLFASAVRAARG
ncbi:MAG: hypothetical protein QOH49_2022 [Acidobacteriota bacterium]|jgi:hypothetical protein|nr:hypothetical protein [Acidobacteriota bacterium]